MARYGMDYDRGFRGGADYGRDFREGDEFTAGTREYNTVHNDWHINRGWDQPGNRGWTGRPAFGGGYNAGYGTGGGTYRAQGGYGGSLGRDPGGYQGEAGWSGWSQSGREPGDYGHASRGGYLGSDPGGFGGLGDRGYDVEDYQRFTANPDRRPSTGYTGGSYSGGYSERGGLSGGYPDRGGFSGGYSGGSYGGPDRGGYGASNWSRGYGSDFDRGGYDHDIGDRVREGWDHLRDRARHFFRR